MNWSIAKTPSNLDVASEGAAKGEGLELPKRLVVGGGIHAPSLIFSIPSIKGK